MLKLVGLGLTCVLALARAEYGDNLHRVARQTGGRVARSDDDGTYAYDDVNDNDFTGFDDDDDYQKNYDDVDDNNNGGGGDNGGGGGKRSSCAEECGEGTECVRDYPYLFKACYPQRDREATDQKCFSCKKLVCPSDPKKCIPNEFLCSCNLKTHSKVNRTYDGGDCKQCAEFCTRLEGHCTFNDYCECPDGFKRTTEKHTGNQKECHQCIREDKADDGEECNQNADCGGNACKADAKASDTKVCCDSTGQNTGCNECGGRNGECSDCRGTHIFEGDDLGTCATKLGDGDECDPRKNGDDCYHGRCTKNLKDSKGVCCSAKGGNTQDHCNLCEAGSGDCLECSSNKYILRNGICSLKWILSDEDDGKHDNCVCNGKFEDVGDDHHFGSSSCESTVGGRPFCFTDKDACVPERIPVTSSGVQQNYDFYNKSWAYAPCGHCPVAASSTCNTNNTCTCNPEMYTQVELTTRAGDSCFQCYPYCSSELGFCTSSDNCECKRGFTKAKVRDTSGKDCYQCESDEKLKDGEKCFPGESGNGCVGDVCRVDINHDAAQDEQDAACCDANGQKDGCVSCEAGTGKCLQCFTETHEFDRSGRVCVAKPTTTTPTTPSTTSSSSSSTSTTTTTTQTSNTDTTRTYTGTTETTTKSTVTKTSVTLTTTTTETTRTVTTKTTKTATTTTDTTRTKTTTTKTKTTETDTATTKTSTTKTDTTTTTATTATTTTGTIQFTDSDTGEAVAVKKADAAEVVKAQRVLESAQERLSDCKDTKGADCSREEGKKMEAEADVRAAMGLEVSAAPDASTVVAPIDPVKGSSSSLMIIVIAAAVIIIAIIVAVILVTRKGGNGANTGEAASFENPMYDSGTGYNEPAYVDTGAMQAGGSAGTSGYMDVGPQGGAQGGGGGGGGTSGYMDVNPSAAAAGGGPNEGVYDNMGGNNPGYMDVAPEPNGFDDSDEEV